MSSNLTVCEAKHRHPGFPICYIEIRDDFAENETGREEVDDHSSHFAGHVLINNASFHEIEAPEAESDETEGHGKCGDQDLKKAEH